MIPRGSLDGVRGAWLQDYGCSCSFCEESARDLQIQLGMLVVAAVRDEKRHVRELVVVVVAMTWFDLV